MSRFHESQWAMSLLAVACACPTGALADENAFLVSVQNHCFAGADQNGYTNGLFLSWLQSAAPGATEVAGDTPLTPLLTALGLAAPTLVATSLEQIMITPRNIEHVTPTPDDIPYVGLLAVRAASVRVRENRADTLALKVGVIGPASGAEQMQKLIHRINGATDPRGWDTQGPTRLLVGVEAYRTWRLAFGQEDRGFDAAALFGGSLGNRESSLGGSLLLRYGMKLQRSFPSLARAIGRSGDPFMTERGWFAYAGLSADRIMGERWIGSDARSNIAKPRKSQIDPMLGFTYGWERSSLSFSLHRATPLVETRHDRQRYGSITYVRDLD